MCFHFAYFKYLLDICMFGLDAFVWASSVVCAKDIQQSIEKPNDLKQKKRVINSGTHPANKNVGETILTEAAKSCLYIGR